MISYSKRNFLKITSNLSLTSFIFLLNGKTFFKKNIQFIRKKFINDRIWILAEKD